jgi:hypothetical protein
VRVLGFLFVFATVPLAAQVIHSDHIKGIRVAGTAQAGFPVVLRDSHPVRISFDVDNVNSENFRIKVFHCTKDWKITASSFVNDEFRNFTRYQIPYRAAPAGVKGYRWTYSLKIPGFTGLERFQYSGNYTFEIWNDDQTELLAEGKFFVAERIANEALTMYNRYLPSAIAPLNQANTAVIKFSIPSQASAESNPLFRNFVNTVVLIRNREIETPCRIDADIRTPNTFVDGYGTDRLEFMIDNLRPGNEYRRIDLRNADLYPPDELLRPRDGADLSRWLFQGAPDEDGTSELVRGNRYADYVEFQFELGRPEENSGERIYVVGDFNGWRIDERWRLQYDAGAKQYTLATLLRRGAYDYQYVLNGSDWIALEGNDWRTVSLYTALLYYSDPNYGGFDRILLAAQARSPGGTNPTTQ